jgi:hypothetical protein
MDEDSDSEVEIPDELAVDQADLSPADEVIDTSDTPTTSTTTAGTPKLKVTSGRTVATSLGSITRVPEAATMLARLARLVHSIRRDAYALITHHALRTLEAGKPLPDLHEDAVVHRFLLAVTTNDRSSSTYWDLDAAIANTMKACTPDFQRHVLLPGCVSILEYERRRFTAQLQTLVHKTFRARVGELLALRLQVDDATFNGMTAEEKKRRRWSTKFAMAAVTRPNGTKGFEGDVLAAMESVIEDLKLGAIDLKIKDTYRSLPYVLKAAPTRFLPALNAINRELEAAKKARFRLLPLITSNVPGFITVDQRTLTAVGLIDDTQKAAIKERIGARRDAVRPFTTRLRELRKRVGELEKGWKDADYATEQARMVPFRIKWRLENPIEVAAEADAEGASSVTDQPAETTLVSGGKRKRGRSPAKARPPKKRKPKQMPKKPVLTPEQRETDKIERQRRAEVLKPFKDEIKTVESNPVYQELLDDAVAEKRDTFEAVFNVEKAIRHPEQWQYSLSTDGLSVRLILQRPQTTIESVASEASKTERTLTAMPANGVFPLSEIAPLFTNGHVLDEADRTALKGMPPIKLNDALNERLRTAHSGTSPYLTIGIDPGKLELIVATNPDVAAHNHQERHELPLPSTEIERKERPQAQAAIRYTSKQRKFDTTPGKYILNKKERHSTERQERFEQARAYRESIKLTDPERMKTTLESLSVHSNCAATSTGFRAFADARRLAQPFLDETYADDGMLHRKLRWKAFIDKQKSLQGLVNQLKAIERATEQQIILAYGAWGMRAGVAGAPVNKGNPPCLGVGLATYLARFFVVVWVPEHYTSKTCFHCGCHECCNHPKIAEQHRPQRDARALKKRDDRLAMPGATDAEKAKAEDIYQKTIAKVPELRSLRFCPGCTRCLNRDRNAANNIGLQFKRLAFGLGTIKAMTSEEEALHTADVELAGVGE